MSVCVRAAAAFGGSPVVGLGFGTVNNELESQMRTELAVAFRKLAKRDETTRLKGISEIKELLSSVPEASDEERCMVERFRNEWVALLLASERTVRLHALHLFQLFATRLGKYVSPCLFHYANGGSRQAQASGALCARVCARVVLCVEL